MGKSVPKALESRGLFKKVCFRRRPGVLCWLQCVSADCGDGETAVCADVNTGEIFPGDEHCPSHGAECGPACVARDGGTVVFAATPSPAFCVGDGVDMHMDGFRSAFEKHAPACVNLYVAAATLDKRWKYGLGVAAAFAVGLAVEFLSRFRRRLFAARAAGEGSAGTLKAALVAAHFLQVVLGYLAMFAAMTYFSRGRTRGTSTRAFSDRMFSRKASRLGENPKKDDHSSKDEPK